MKKVLILSYFYPPAGGAGVQRTAKFVKYLPMYGYEPVVVYGDGEDYKNCNLKDSALISDVKTVKAYNIFFSKSDLFKKKVFEKKIFKAFVDRWKLCWNKAAFRVCCKVIEKEQPDILYVSVSPFNAADVVMKLSEKYDLPWVVDMRDPWALDPFMCYPTKLHFMRDLKKMSRCCEHAEAVVMNTPASARAVCENFSGVSDDKVFAVTNGWDQSDIDLAKIETSESDKLRIVHTGHFQSGYAIRTDPDVRKKLDINTKKIQDSLRYFYNKPDLLGRTPYYLFSAIRKNMDNSKIKDNDIEIILAGELSATDKMLINRFGLEKICKLTGYLSHDESMTLIKSADVLFLPLHKAGKTSEPLIVPGKTYEYMAAKKCILGVVPEGDCMDFLVQSGCAVVCEPGDEEKLCSIITDLVEKKKSSQGLICPNEEFIKRFERKTLTKKLSEVFDKVLNTNN